MSNRSKQSTLGGLALLGSLLGAPVALAAGAATTESGRADELAAQAANAVSKGALEEARRLYLESMAKKPTFDTLGNLGSVELALKRYRDCAEHLTMSLRSYPPTGSDARKTKTEEKLAECRAKVAAIRMTVTPEGTSVSVDGVEMAKAPLSDPLFVEPGARTFSFSLDGHRSTQRQVDAVAGKEAPLLVKLEPSAAQESKSAPSVAEPPAASARASKPEAPKSEPIAASAPLWPVIAGGATAALLVGGGVGLFLASSSTENDGDALRAELAASGKRCPDDCAELLDTYDSASAQRNAATGLFVGAGIATAGTAAYYLIARPTRGASSTAWLPVVRSDGAGMLLQGTF